MNPIPKKTPQGRGAAENPPNRFEILAWEDDPQAFDPEAPGPATEFYKDKSKSLIVTNDSPDLPFDASLNVYRGCEHGCIYCYARPYHEYLGFSAGLDFETKIMVKENAPELLRRELASPKWQPKVLAMSGVTDCYQPVEKKLGLTRACLEVLAEFRNPVGIITKNHLVTRDIDLLQELASVHAAAVFVSVTTLDGDLARKLEPRASTPRHRMEAIEDLAKAGVPVGVMAAPVIPALNDAELPAILTAAARAGARFAGYTLVRLPHGLGDLFTAWLEENFPDRKNKVLHRLEELRGGKLNDSRFGTRQRGEGPFAEQIADLFAMGKKKAGIGNRGPELSTASFRRPAAPQLSLFSS